MRKIALTILLIGASFLSFAQLQSKAIAVEGAISTHKESIFGLEYELNTPGSILSYAAHGSVFTAKQGQDRTTHVEVGPRVYANFDDGTTFVSPYVGVTYQYSSSPLLPVSEFGGNLGLRLGLHYGRFGSGIVYLRPNIVLSKHDLYSLGLDFGGLF